MRKKYQAKYKGFEASIEYSNEDQLFVGKVVNSEDIILFDGNDMDEAIASFHAVIDEFIEDNIVQKATGKAKKG